MAVENKDDDLVMVGDGVEEGDQAAVPPVGDEGAGKEDEGGEDDGELSADADDVRVGGGEAVDDEKTEARRVERRSRRQRQKDARDRDQRELKFLRNRNEQVERQIGDLTRRQVATETATIDQRIAQLDNAMRSADDVYAKAITANEGQDAAEAMRIRDNLKEQRDGLKSYKEQASQAPVDEGPDPELISQVRSWSERNTWFDFGRRDEDSAIAGAIDDMLIRDGYDPRTPEYYDELDKRVARRLPHLVKKGKGDAGNGADDLGGDDHLDDAGDDDLQNKGGQRKPGGPKFRIGGQERPLRPNEVHISRDRKEAMQEAGVWDDPVLRKNYLKRYAEWDREHADELG